MRASRGKLLVPFVGPAFVFYVVFFVAPTIGSLWISLHVWSGPGSDFSFVGFQNYVTLWSDPVFRTAFANTIELLIVVGLAVFAFSFVFMAILQNARGRRTVRAILFFPNVIPPVALGIMWITMLNPNIGFVDDGLRHVGLARAALSWLSPDLIFRTAMVGLVWIYTGFFSVILLAGADRIPRDYFEAAQLEGANALQRLIRITIPMTWDVVSIAAVLWLISAIRIFDFIFILTGGEGEVPSVSSWTLAIHMYEISLGTRQPLYELGYGSAIAVVMIATVAVLVVAVRRLLHREAIEY